MSLDAAQIRLAEAIAALEAAEKSLNLHRTGKLEITSERIAARNAVHDAKKAVREARLSVTRETWIAMLAETEEILPKLRADYAETHAAWLDGDAQKDDSFSGQQFFQMDDARERLDAIEKPLLELQWQIKWAESAKERYAQWLAGEMEKESLDYTEQREYRADEQERKQQWMDYRPPWQGLG